MVLVTCVCHAKSALVKKCFPEIGISIDIVQ